MRFKEFYMKEKEKMLPKIYIDMDGVLTDWAKAFEKLSDGVEAKEYEKKNGKESYWPLIAKAGETFWGDMEWTKDGKKLFAFIKKYKPTILSAPTRDKNSEKACVKGKHRWLKKEIPSVPYILEKDKHKYANEKSILIDDYIEKIKKWKDAGGIGIHHKSASTTINTLKQMGFK